MSQITQLDPNSVAKEEPRICPKCKKPVDYEKGVYRIGSLDYCAGHWRIEIDSGLEWLKLNGHI